MLKTTPKVDLIKAVMPFWDLAHNVFHFSNFEFTPTLEDIASYAGSDRGLRHTYPLAPRAVTPHKFLKLLSIS